jgi:tetratricopeptide (TPR) repeat protein
MDYTKFMLNVHRATLLLIGILVNCQSSTETKRPVPLVLVQPADANNGLVTIESKNVQAVALYKEALDLRDNWHTAEASDAAKRALALDPSFAQAKAIASMMVPGKDGVRMLEEAVTAAAALPVPVQLELQALLLLRQRESTKAIEIYRQVIALAPKDWRPHYRLAIALGDEQHDAEAITMLKRCIEIDPKAGPPYGQLGGMYFDNLATRDEGIALYKKYVEVAPQESTAYDFLGQIELALGHLPEAEKALRQAVAMGKPISYNQLSYTRFYQRDWTGGREALAKGIAAVPSPLLQFDFRRSMFWSYLAQGNAAAAHTAATDYQAAAKQLNLSSPALFAELMHAFVDLEMGKPKDSITRIQIVRAAVTSGAGLDPGFVKRMGNQSAGWLVVSYSRSGDLISAKRVLAELEVSVAASPGDYRSEQFLHLGQAEFALANKDTKAADVAFAACSGGQFDELGPYCEYQRALLLDANGDKPTAAALKAKIVSTPNPDGRYMYLWFKSGGKLF